MYIRKIGKMLSTNDRHLLLALNEDARQSIKRLGHQAGLNREKVAYRLKRLPGLVRTTAIINQSLFAAGIANMRCTLVRTSKERFEEIIGYLQGHPSVNWIAELCGTADLAFTFLYRDNQDLAATLAGITEFIGDNLKEHVLSLYIEEVKFDRSGLFTQTGIDPQPGILFAKPAPPVIDDDDCKLLKLLQQDARTPSVALAQHTTIADDMVRLRIRSLEKRSIIRGYTTVLDTDKLGFESYYMGLRLRSMTPEIVEMLRAYVYSNPYIVFCARVSGSEDVLIDLKATSRSHFRELLLGIRTALGEYLVADEFQIGLEEHKEVYVPEAFISPSS